MTNSLAYQLGDRDLNGRDLNGRDLDGRDLNGRDLIDGADGAMRALVEPRRRAILRLVAHQELAAGEIAAAFDVNRTTVSQHLTVLKGAGLLSERREGTRRIYRARLEGLTGLRTYLDDIWSNALDIARGIAEAEHDGNETRHC